MPSKSSKKSSSSSYSSSRPSASSPTLTTSSSGYYQSPQYHYSQSPYQTAYQMPAQQTYQPHQQAYQPHQQQATSSASYNPAAIHSWVSSVQPGSSQSHRQVNMSDPAVQAYMQAKMGLYQHASAQSSSHKSSSRGK